MEMYGHANFAFYLAWENRRRFVAPPVFSGYILFSYSRGSVSPENILLQNGMIVK